MKKVTNSKKILSLTLASLFALSQGSISLANGDDVDKSLGGLDSKLGYSEEYKLEDPLQLSSVYSLQSTSTRATRNFEASFVEREPNNSISSRLDGLIEVLDDTAFHTAYGVVGSSDPVDYFILTVESSAVYETGIFAPTNQYVEYSIYDSNGKLFVPETNSFRKVYLESNTTYYVKAQWIDGRASSGVPTEPYRVVFAKI